MAAIHVFLAVLCILSVSDAGGYTEEDNVLVLTEDNFDRAVNEFQSLMVEFYAPWCGHCQALAPEYANVAKLVQDEMKDVRLAKVDATAEKQLAKKYEVSGYPTIKFFHEGKVFDYTSGRTTHDFITFLKKKIGPIVTTVESLEAARAVAHSEDLVIFGFFKDMSSSAAKSFLEVSAENDDTAFAVSSTAEVLSEYGITDSGVVAFKKFDEGRVDMKGAVTIESVKEFLLENSLPLVNEYTSESAHKLLSGDIKKHLIMFISKKKDNNILAKVGELKSAALSFRGKVLFMYINIDDDENARILEFFGLKREDCPVIRYVSLTEDLIKYKPETNELSAKVIEEFVQKILDGKLTPHLLSDKLPEDWDSNPVKVLVGSNFDEVVKDNTKNVLVMFYAPWCGHCKSLAPVWDELGKKFENHSDLVIAKMDATVNELADIKVESFPLIRYFPKDKDDIVDYQGDRTLEALVQFVESNGEVHYRKEDKKDESKQTKDEL